jgi:hypothetical protein
VSLVSLHDLRRVFRRAHSVAGARAPAAFALLLALAAGRASAVPELDVEYVIANPRPRVADIGYKEPETFDPFTDRLYQGGFRYGGPPVEIPQEVRYLTAIGRATAMKRILACADAWYYPFSHTAVKSEPPGIDIEILSRIQFLMDMRTSNLLLMLGMIAAGIGMMLRSFRDASQDAPGDTAHGTGSSPQDKTSSG